MRTYAISTRNPLEVQDVRLFNLQLFDLPNCDLHDPSYCTRRSAVPELPGYACQVQAKHWQQSRFLRCLRKGADKRLRQELSPEPGRRSVPG